MIRNIAIIGAGNVGSTLAYTLASAGTVEELSLIDINMAKAEGEVLDIRDGLSFLRPVNVRAGGYSLCREANIAIITAGVNQKPGQTRLDLLHQNAALYRRIIPSILEYNDQLLVLVVTNPVDPLTYLSVKLSGLPSDKVFGSGTVLDTARFRNQISLHCRINPRNIHGYVIGEHGDGAVVVWSATQVAGIKLDQFCLFCGKGCSAQEEIGQKVRNAAEQIITRKGATYYAISLAVKQIVQSIFGNENSILTISSLVHQYSEISNVCFSLPAVINRNGIKDILYPDLADPEKEALIRCAAILKQAQNQICKEAGPVPVLV
ncbi:MAG: L-lactate dehydrogenase [Dethiobacter sp.]|nr:L-lactate dehydrogenase [Dethiobacter sp.]